MRSKDSASRQPGQIRSNSTSAARDHALLATTATEAKRKRRRRDIGIRLRGIRGGDKPATATPCNRIHHETHELHEKKAFRSALEQSQPALRCSCSSCVSWFPLN